MRWMMTGAILVNSILKLTVLHNTIYSNLFSFFPFLHLIASTAIEHAVFVSAVILGKWSYEVLTTALIIITHDLLNYLTSGTVIDQCHLDFLLLLRPNVLGLWCLPNSRNLMNGQTKFKRKVYVALAFPEIFKVAAVLLQIFDDEPTLLLLIGLLITSIQHTSLESVTSISTSKLNTIMLLAVFLRFFVRCVFHRLHDAWLLGVVC